MDAQREKTRKRENGPYHRHDSATYGFNVPESWPDDGGLRREPVIEIEAKRVVRLVGWVRCLSRSSYRHRFFSPDVRGVRTCDQCKKTEAINQSNQGGRD